MHTLIDVFIALQWRCSNLLHTEQPKVTKSSTPLGLKARVDSLTCMLCCLHAIDSSYISLCDTWSVLYLLNFVLIHVCLDWCSHSITMQACTPIQIKTAKIHQITNTPGVCSIRWNLAVLYWRGVNASIVMVWKHQPRWLWMRTKFSKLSTSLLTSLWPAW